MNNFIVYDFETSGRSSRFDQILPQGSLCMIEIFWPWKKLILGQDQSRYCALNKRA